MQENAAALVYNHETAGELQFIINPLDAIVIFCQTHVGARLIFSMLLLDAELIFVTLPPGAGLFFESEKRSDPSRAFMPVTKAVLEIKKKCKKQTCRELNSLQVG